jgi:hypothetical protein
MARAEVWCIDLHQSVVEEGLLAEGRKLYVWSLTRLGRAAAGPVLFWPFPQASNLESAN